MVHIELDTVFPYQKLHMYSTRWCYNGVNCLACALTFAPSPSSFGANFRGLCGASSYECGPSPHRATWTTFITACSSSYCYCYLMRDTLIFMYYIYVERQQLFKKKQTPKMRDLRKNTVNPWITNVTSKLMIIVKLSFFPL